MAKLKKNANPEARLSEGTRKGRYRCSAKATKHRSTAGMSCPNLGPTKAKEDFDFQEGTCLDMLC